MANVYKVTNTLTGKAYIGYTTKEVDRRWKEHLNRSRRGINAKFDNALRKYPPGVWLVETLLQDVNTPSAKAAETEFISKFDTYNNGYNSTLGGDGNTSPTRSKESNEGRGTKLRGVPKSYPRMHGKQHTEETKRKISLAHVGMEKPWVKWTTEQIEKRSSKRRSLTQEGLLMLEKLVTLGVQNSEIANKLGVSLHVVKKWKRIISRR